MGKDIKSLLIKDFQILKSQKQFMGILVFVAMTILCFNKDMEFCIGFITMMFSFFTITTMSYDEHDNGMSYMFCLPVTRRSYVREKYLLGFIFSFGSCFLTSVVCYVINIFTKAVTDNSDFWIYALSIFLLSYVMLAIELPIHVKFGIEKSRIILVVTIAVISGAIYGSLSFLENNIPQIMQNSLMFACVLVIIALIVTVISYNITLKITENKEY